jgi:hypothetical protein
MALEIGNRSWIVAACCIRGRGAGVSSGMQGLGLSIPPGLLPLRLLAAVLAVLLQAGPGQAATGKLRLSGGVSSIDGAAGGGLGPWALIGTQATRGEAGASVFATRLQTRALGLSVAGVAAAWDDRVELSLARQRLDTGRVLAPLGLAGLVLQQDIVGLKLRLAGDAVLDSDRPWPQIAIGLLHKRADAGALAPTLQGALGARRADTEAYIAATKLWLEPGLLANLTLRATRANQGGLLGHGRAGGVRRQLRPELSLAWLPHPHWALGLEARAKPDLLAEPPAASGIGRGVLAEDPWFDVFVAWAPLRQASFTLAWVDLGRVVPGLEPRRQSGAYLSAQLAF